MAAYVVRARELADRPVRGELSWAMYRADLAGLVAEGPVGLWVGTDVEARRFRVAMREAMARSVPCEVRS